MLGKKGRGYFSKNIIPIALVLGICLILAYYSSGFTLKSSIFSNECPEEILPPAFFLKQKGDNLYFVAPTIITDFSSAGTWGDGTELRVDNILDPACHKGNSYGENVNYFYCDNFYYSNYIKEIDDDGNIINAYTVNYNVKVVLEEGSYNHFKAYNIISAFCS